MAPASFRRANGTTTRRQGSARIGPGRTEADRKASDTDRPAALFPISGNSTHRVRAIVTAGNSSACYVGLGDHDVAMVWLNKAYEARFNPSILSRRARDPLRSDARFKNLLRRIGLPG